MGSKVFPKLGKIINKYKKSKLRTEHNQDELIKQFDQENKEDVIKLCNIISNNGHASHKNKINSFLQKFQNENYEMSADDIIIFVDIVEANKQFIEMGNS